MCIVFMRALAVFLMLGFSRTTNPAAREALHGGAAQYQVARYEESIVGFEEAVRLDPGYEARSANGHGERWRFPRWQ